MAAAGISHTKTLEELETHLREEFHRRVAAGADAERAFADASAQLGNGAQLRGEFEKVPGRLPVPALAGVGVLLVSAVWICADLMGGWFGWILNSHIVTLTIGYEAALLCGCFASAWVVSSAESICSRCDVVCDARRSVCARWAGFGLFCQGAVFGNWDDGDARGFTRGRLVRRDFCFHAVAPSFG